MCHPIKDRASFKAPPDALAEHMSTYMTTVFRLLAFFFKFRCDLLYTVSNYLLFLFLFHKIIYLSVVIVFLTFLTNLNSYLWATLYIYSFIFECQA